VAVEDNKGEMILQHSGDGSFAEVASNVGTTLTIRTDGLVGGESLVIDGQPAITNVPDLILWGPLDREGYVLIAGGPGLGQARRIASHTRTTVTVDQPWRVPPGAGSKVALLYLYKDTIQYRNELNAFPGRLHSIKPDRQLRRRLRRQQLRVRRRGQSLAPDAHGPQHLRLGRSPSYWNEMRNETALQTAHSADTFICWLDYYSDPTNKYDALGPFLLGNIIRGGAAKSSARGTTGQAPTCSAPVRRTKPPSTSSACSSAPTCSSLSRSPAPSAAWRRGASRRPCSAACA